MYYQKYFSGSVDATTTTTQYYMGLDKIATSTSCRSGHIKNRSDVIGNAIASTLKDVGYPNAYWDSTSGYIFFDKTNSRTGFYLSVQSSTLYISIGFVSSSYQYIATPTSGYGYAGITWNSYNSSPFYSTGQTASDYKFYITIKGEPKGVMSISIGTYNSPSSEYSYLHIFRGTDKRNNSDVLGFNAYQAKTPHVAIFTKYSDATYIRELNQITDNRTLTLDDEQKIVLIPVFFEYGYIFLNNTFFNPGISTIGFYKIGNDTYYISSYWMTKCITTV